MSSTHVSAALRRLVVRRAQGLCEYCLIHEADAYFGCQIDHIVSEKHGGPTTEDNLAYACLFCNRFKGSDVGSIAGDTSSFVRFFNPRTDLWSAHFDLLEDMAIVPLSEIGIATVKILGINSAQRLLERQRLNEEGRYPVSAARALIGKSSP